MAGTWDLLTWLMHYVHMHAAVPHIRRALCLKCSAHVSMENPMTQSWLTGLAGSAEHPVNVPHLQWYPLQHGSSMAQGLDKPAREWCSPLS